MDLTKLALVLAGIVAATFFLTLFGFSLYHLFPLLLFAQGMFIGVMSLFAYHGWAMVTFSTTLFGFVSLQIYWLVARFIK